MFIHYLNEQNGEAHRLTKDIMEKWTPKLELKQCFLLASSIWCASWVRHADDAPIDDFDSGRSDIKLRLYTVHIRDQSQPSGQTRRKFTHIALECFERIRAVFKHECLRLY